MRSGGQDLLLLLRHMSLFESLDEKHLLELVARGVRKRLDKNQTVFFQAAAASGLYVVLTGRVKVFKSSPRGRRQTLMIMGPGDPIGEVAALSGGTYPAGAETLEASELLYIPRQAFLDVVAREPEVAMRLLAALSSRLRAFASLIEDLSLRDVSERLAAYLLALARQSPEEQAMRLDVTKAELAAAVGTVPETLSRAFQQLSRSGAVQTSGRTVEILDRALLERQAAGRP